jgi:hypothetical protein
MNRTLVLLIGLVFAGAAQAQIKCWTGADGKRACGDTPPPGAKVTTVKVPSSPSPSAPASASPAAKDAKKGPLTPAEREQEYRKRQDEAQKTAAKDAEEKKDADTKRENCARARESLGILEAGGRIARTDAKGERYFLDDAQREQETAKARQLVQQSCN